MPEKTFPPPPSPIVSESEAERLGEALYALQDEFELTFARDTRGAIILAAVLVSQALDRLTAAVREAV